jgi:hypothetical protein
MMTLLKASKTRSRRAIERQLEYQRAKARSLSGQEEQLIARMGRPLSRNATNSGGSSTATTVG